MHEIIVNTHRAALNDNIGEDAAYFLREMIGIFIDIAYNKNIKL